MTRSTPNRPHPCPPAPEENADTSSTTTRIFRRLTRIFLNFTGSIIGCRQKDVRARPGPDPYHRSVERMERAGDRVTEGTGKPELRRKIVPERTEREKLFDPEP